MFLEIDQVVLSKSDWDLVVRKDVSVIERLRLSLEDMITYDHVFPFNEETDIVVSLRDLRKHGLIDCVKLLPPEPITKEKAV